MDSIDYNRTNKERKIVEIEKIYTMVIGLTVAFLAVSFANISKLAPIHFLWILTLFIVTKDWLDDTGYEYLGNTKLHDAISLIYVLLLMLLPITLRLIEEKVLPMYAYPIIILTFTGISFLYLILCYRQMRKDQHSDKEKLDYAAHLAEDIIAMAIYIGVLIVSIVMLPIYPSWISVVIITIAVIIFENMLDKIFVYFLKTWIKNEFLI